MPARAIPHLLDLLRGREGSLAPATLRILDAALREGEAAEHPADLQAAALAAIAMLVVVLTPDHAVDRRAKDAEGLLRRLIHAHRRRVAELALDLPALQREMHRDGLNLVFEESWQHLMANRPIAPRWIAAGVESADHIRQVLMSAALQHGMHDLFARVFGEQAVDYAGATLTTVDTAAFVCGSLFDANNLDDEGFVDLLLGEFRGTLERSIAYWRAKKGN